MDETFEVNGNRLTTRQKTNIDLLRDIIPKPQGYLPIKNLPTWLYMPLEQKIPMIPAPPGEIVISRGMIGETLLQPTTTYATLDPFNRERVPADNYEALHDTFMKSFFTHPLILKLLRGHGLINDDNKVLCSIKEFNRYRLYLATLFNDKLREKVLENDRLRELEREQDRALLLDERLKVGESRQTVREARTARAKGVQEEILEAKRKNWRLKQGQDQERRNALQEKRRNEQLGKVVANEDKMAIQRDRILMLKAKEIERRREALHLSTLKQMQSAAHREHEENQRKLQREEKLTRWFEAKLVSAAERLEREKEIQAVYVDQIRHKSVRRQKRVEKFREELPLRIEQSKAKQRRLDEIVRKYAMRWLNRVRARLSKPIDEKHGSLWYSGQRHALQDGMKLLYEKSGYEKLDDVVMNILKFKEALKKQLEAEEAEEKQQQEDFLDE